MYSETEVRLRRMRKGDIKSLFYGVSSGLSKILGNKDNYLFVAEGYNNKLLGCLGLYDINMIDRKAKLYLNIAAKTPNIISINICRAVLDTAFKVLNMHRISAACVEYERNKIGILKEAGFRQEVVMRDAEYRNGRYNNVVILGLLNEDRKK